MEKKVQLRLCGSSREAVPHVQMRAQRVRRQSMRFPPRPCVNGTMTGSASGEAVSDGMEEQSEVGNEEEQRQEEEEEEETK